MENSERLDRKTRPGFEPGKCCLPGLKAEPFRRCEAVQI